MAEDFLAPWVLPVMFAAMVMTVAIVWSMSTNKRGLNLVRKYTGSIWIDLILDDLGQLKILRAPLLEGKIEIYGQAFGVNEAWINNKICYGQYLNGVFVQRRLITVTRDEIKEIADKLEKNDDKLRSSQYLLRMRDLEHERELAETSVDLLVREATEVEHLVGQDRMEMVKGLAIAAMMVLFTVFMLGQTYDYASKNLVPARVEISADCSYTFRNGTAMEVQLTKTNYSYTPPEVPKTPGLGDVADIAGNMVPKIG